MAAGQRQHLPATAQHRDARHQAATVLRRPNDSDNPVLAGCIVLNGLDNGLRAPVRADHKGAALLAGPAHEVRSPQPPGGDQHKRRRTIIQNKQARQSLTRRQEKDNQVDDQQLQGDEHQVVERCRQAGRQLQIVQIVSGGQQQPQRGQDHQPVRFLQDKGQVKRPATIDQRPDEQGNEDGGHRRHHISQPQ